VSAPLPAALDRCRPRLPAAGRACPLPAANLRRGRSGASGDRPPQGGHV